MSGLTLTGAGSTPSRWLPTALTGYVDSPYSFADLRAAGKLWQDTAKTVPAVADGDPIRVAVCGASDWTAPSDAARPVLYAEGGGKWSASFDGVDDGLWSPSSLTGGQTLAFRAVATGLSPRILNGRDENVLLSTMRAGLLYFFASGIAYQDAGDTNPHIMLVTKPAAGDWSLRIDGVDRTVAARNADWGRPTLGVSDSYSETFIGRVSGLALTASNLSAGEIVLLETYLGAL